MKKISSILMFLFATNAYSHASEQSVETTQTNITEENLSEVSVRGIKNAGIKPYRVMSAGLDAFQEHHSRAPAAQLKFRLSKRTDANQYRSNLDGVSLRIVGSDTSIPVPIASDGTFILPRSETAYVEDSDLILNQKKSLIRVSPDVRTPGLPSNVRRLGDLRLECEVIVAIRKKELNFAQRAAINVFMLGGDWCARGVGKFSFALPDWAVNATLIYEGTRKSIPVLGYDFIAPIQDASVPDDALVEFEFRPSLSKDNM
ncbi:MAG: hypothetical protein NTY70_20075 [Burkholderiales bacterium]|nr:hypothetical protein [Burkholderiales bacterium]